MPPIHRISSGNVHLRETAVSLMIVSQFSNAVQTSENSRTRLQPDPEVKRKCRGLFSVRGESNAHRFVAMMHIPAAAAPARMVEEMKNEKDVRDRNGKETVDELL